VQERARLLQEEIAARMGEATSRNLFVLSIATTTLLPITLITGIFGMNLRGLPMADHPHGFHVVMVGIAVTVLVALWLLRRIGAL
jgi:zinc transporter